MTGVTRKIFGAFGKAYKHHCLGEDLDSLPNVDPAGHGGIPVSIAAGVRSAAKDILIHQGDELLVGK